MLVKKGVSNFNIETSSYTLEYDKSRPLHVKFKFNNGISSELFVASGCDRDEMIDELIALNLSEINEDCRESLSIVFTGKTTLWEKVEYIFECYEDKFLYHYVVNGNGRLDNARFFEGFEYNNPILKDKFAPTFCGPCRYNSYHRPEKYFMTSSKPGFDVVYTSSINSTDTRYLMYYEDSRIGIGDRIYYGGDWLVTPPPYLYMLGTRQKDKWVSLGLVIKKGEYGFNNYTYKGGEKWGLFLDYDGYTEIKGSWESPKVLFQESNEVYEGLEKYIGYLQQNSYVPEKNRSNIPRWWKEPIFGGWGEQMYQSSHWQNYFTSKSHGWSGGSADLCTQKAYDKMLDTLEEKGINPTILIVDNRWFKTDCTLDVDEKLWPNMKAWIEKQHKKGRRVILWVSPFAYSHIKGIDIPLNEHMVRDASKDYELKIDTDVFYAKNDSGEFITKKKNREKRILPEVPSSPDESIVADIQNPCYEKRLREKIEFLLSPEGLNADGFEFDYTHFGIKTRGFKRISGEDHIPYGAELIHKTLEIYYDAAKKANPEALIITHTFNPYFNDVIDMLRLQDIYTDNASIVDQMSHRAKVASLSCPKCVIHTDQHPMVSLDAWREYAKHQSKIGNPCLYYVTGIETTSEKFTEDDYELIRRTWNEHHEELNNESQ